uniref:Uncharacterized protein n=1 Tax=Arundo donax TaxID=35708 RepID=A0A0A9BB49_ARUDO
MNHDETSQPGVNQEEFWVPKMMAKEYLEYLGSYTTSNGKFDNRKVVDLIKIFDLHLWMTSI